MRRGTTTIVLFGVRPSHEARLGMPLRKMFSQQGSTFGLVVDSWRAWRVSPWEEARRVLTPQFHTRRLAVFVFGFQFSFAETHLGSMALHGQIR